MKKIEFLNELRKGLSALPDKDIEERINFYSEIIDDRMEEGILEEAAVSELGSVNEVISQILSDIPLTKLVKQRVKSSRKLKTLEIVLLVLGSPLWLSLIIAAIAVVFALYVSLWAIIVSLWAVFAFFIACAFGGIFSAIVFALNSSIFSAILVFSAGFVCAGLSIFSFYGFKSATKGILVLTKKIALFIKNCFIKKEES